MSARRACDFQTRMWNIWSALTGNHVPPKTSAPILFFFRASIELSFKKREKFQGIIYQAKLKRKENYIIIHHHHHLRTFSIKCSSGLKDSSTIGPCVPVLSVILDTIEKIHHHPPFPSSRRNGRCPFKHSSFWLWLSFFSIPLYFLIQSVLP